MGLLTGDLAKAIYNGFKGKLLNGQLRKESAIGGLDEFGDPSDTVVEYHRVEGFVDRYSAFFKASAGIPDTDLMVGILAQSIPGIKPSIDDKVKMGDQWYQIRKVNVDPATALWDCQSFAIGAPIDGS